MLSMALVDRSVRASVGGTPRRSAVRVSSRPSRRLAAAPEVGAVELGGPSLAWLAVRTAAPAQCGGGGEREEVSYR